jgi:hypothetical protein
MPVAALRLVRDHAGAAVTAGVAEQRAYVLLRTITSFALGHALAYINWNPDCVGCGPAIADLLRPDVPTELVGVAETFCGQSNPQNEFQLGLDLMLQGINGT